MPYTIAIYDWSLYTTPAGLSTSDIETDTHANDPANPANYDSAQPSWIGETFTFNGGAASLVEVNDDDDDFEDSYVETGGASTLAQDITINGVTYTAGSVVQNEFSMTDASGNQVWVVAINGTNVGFAYPEGKPPTASEAFTASQGYDGDGADSGDGSTSSTVAYGDVICFTPGTRILTPQGYRRIERLQPGDEVITQDAGAQAIVWMSFRTIDYTRNPDVARPVQIKRGSLTSDLPLRDMIVSPQHRLVFEDDSGPRRKEVFIPARALNTLPGVRVMQGKRAVTFVHLALSRHHILLAEGVRTESCYIAKAAYFAATRSEQKKLLRALPDVGLLTGGSYGPLARPSLTVSDAKHGLAKGHLSYRPTCEAVSRAGL